MFLSGRFQTNMNTNVSVFSSSIFGDKTEVILLQKMNEPTLPAGIRPPKTAFTSRTGNQTHRHEQTRRDTPDVPHEISLSVSFSQWWRMCVDRDLSLLYVAWRLCGPAGRGLSCQAACQCGWGGALVRAWLWCGSSLALSVSCHLSSF